MWWLLALIMMIFVTEVSISQLNELTPQSMVQVATEQQANQTMAYLNAINDYLYSHPQADGTVSDELLPIKAPKGAKNYIQASRVYIYQPNDKGLMWQLEQASTKSALIGKVSSGRLKDASGTDMGVTVPSAITDGYIVYLD